MRSRRMEEAGSPRNKRNRAAAETQLQSNDDALVQLALPAGAGNQSVMAILPVAPPVRASMEQVKMGPFREICT
jgi:hypothetical protein